MKLALSFLFITVSFLSFSQTSEVTILFDYDKNGNRVERKVLKLNIVEKKEPKKLIENETIDDVEANQSASSDSINITYHQPQNISEVLNPNSSYVDSNNKEQSLAHQSSNNDPTSALDHTLALGEQTKVYPNPTRGDIVIEKTIAEGVFDLLLSDAQGKIIAKAQLSNLESIPINLKGKPNGLYLLHLSNGKQTDVVTIIKSE